MSLFTTAGGGSNQLDTGYEISNSLRLNSGDSAYLKKTVGDGNRRKWTLSMWLKKTKIINNTEMYMWSSDDTGAGNAHDGAGFYSFGSVTGDNTSNSFHHQIGDAHGRIVASANARDTSAWYHMVWQIDTANSTAADRMKLFVNGSRITDVVTSNNNPDQNYDTEFNRNSTENYLFADHHYGRYYFEGYVADVAFVDGQAYDASYFGKTDKNGVWVPIEPNVSSWGTNGFFLEFKQTGTGTDASGMGADTSGNDHHWTPANLAATDVTTDTPTNNFATVNSLTETQGVIDFSEGNTQIAGNTTTQGSARSSIQIPPSGKWYIESEFDAIGGSGSNAFGIVTESYTSHSIDASGGRGVKASYSGGAGSRVIQIMNGSSQIGSNINVSAGIIMQLAVDQDNGKAWLGKDDTYYNSSGGTDGNPSTGSNPTFTFTAENFDVLFGVYQGGGGDAIQRQKVNFGNAPFTISSGNSDANGYGNFEYAVPSGFYSLCTKNLAEYG